MSKEEELDKEIQDELAETLESFGDGSNEYELGEDMDYTIKQISEAKKNVKKRAGLAKTTEDGSIRDGDRYIGLKVPEQGKEYDNVEICVCKCHDSKKFDCAECYDHPKHLKENRTFLANRDKDLLSKP